MFFQSSSVRMVEKLTAGVSNNIANKSAEERVRQTQGRHFIEPTSHLSLYYSIPEVYCITSSYITMNILAIN